MPDRGLHGDRHRRVKGASTLKLKSDSAQIAAGGSAKLKLKASKKVRKKVENALENGDSVKANVTVAATDAAGNEATGNAPSRSRARCRSARWPGWAFGHHPFLEAPEETARLICELISSEPDELSGVPTRPSSLSLALSRAEQHVIDRI